MAKRAIDVTTEFSPAELARLKARAKAEGTTAEALVGQTLATLTNGARRANPSTWEIERVEEEGFGRTRYLWRILENGRLVATSASLKGARQVVEREKRNEAAMDGTIYQAPRPVAYQTRGVLAGAYRARGLDRTLLTHLARLDGPDDLSEGIAVCRRSINLADGGGRSSEQRSERPTCERCARKWDALRKAERKGNDYQGGGMTLAQAKKNKRHLDKQRSEMVRRAGLEKLAALRGEIRRVGASKKPRRAEVLSLCRAGRATAQARVKEIRTVGRSMIQAAIKAETKKAREACNVRKINLKLEIRGEAARARSDLKEERRYQREIRQIESRARKRELPRSTAKERRSESDDAVRQNIPPELLALFEKVKRGIKGSDRRSRTEEFLQYVEENPDEAMQVIEVEAERQVARDIRLLRAAEAKEARALRKAGFSDADLAAVPF